jgi:FdhE protein
MGDAACAEVVRANHLEGKSLMKVASITWQDKIERANFLSSQNNAAGDVLRFYVKILQFQRDLQSRLAPYTSDVQQLVPLVPELLELLERSGTPQMKLMTEAATELDWGKELDSYWSERVNQEYTRLSFIALTMLQPFAHLLADKASMPEHLITPRCPFCRCKPQLGVLHPEGDGGKRFLLCSLCGTEWEYRRVICSNCEESDKEKLPVFKSEEVAYIKLAGCETCHSYLKCIDLSIDGHAIPAVDDVASLPMSLWMVDNGFHPAHFNLFGF